MGRTLFFLSSSIFNKKSFNLLFLLCFSQIAAQIFVKEGTPLTVKPGSFISSDTIIYESKSSIENNSSVNGGGKIYVAKGAIITDLSHQLKAELICVNSTRSSQGEKLKPLKKITKTQISAVKPVKKAEIVVRNKPSFYQSTNTDEFYSKRGRKIFAVFAGSAFTLKKNQHAQAILFKKGLVYFYLQQKQNNTLTSYLIFSKDVVDGIKMRGPPKSLFS